MKSLATQDSLVPWFSKAVTNLLGVKFVTSGPILAGAGGEEVISDAANRQQNLADAPKEVFFYNLRPDRDVARQHPHFRFDFIVGDSDAETDSVRRVGNHDMVYWIGVGAGHVFDYNEAVIVRLNQFPDRLGKNVDDNWLCLRRIGNTNREISDDGGATLHTRTKLPDNSISEEKIHRSAIVGVMVAKHTLTNKRFVKAATSLPFYKSHSIQMFDPSV